MPIEGTLVIALLALALAIYFRRELLQLAVSLGLILGLTFIWTSGIEAVWLKGVLSAALVLLVGALINKFNLDERAKSPSSARRQGGSTTPSVCSTCLGTGTTHCYACSGSGEGPGGQGLSLGQSVKCFHCSGSGRIKCSCR